MLIDSELPLSMIQVVECKTKPHVCFQPANFRDFYNNLFKMILIATATAYLIPIFPVLIFAFWVTQKFYLRTSRQIRYIDLETKSPLYTHFIESLAGLSTIRGFGWEAEFERQNRILLQASQRPFFILATIQRWLTLMLDFIVSILAIVLAILAVELRKSINPGLLGLALVNVVSCAVFLVSQIIMLI